MKVGMLDFDKVNHLIDVGMRSKKIEQRKNENLDLIAIVPR